MSSASMLTDTVAFMLFQNLKEGIETGRIANVETAQTEVEAAVAKLDSIRRLLEGPTNTDDLIGKILLEIGSLREAITKWEARLSDTQGQAQVLNEEVAQINLLVEQQQKENAQVLAAAEEANANISTMPLPCVAPAPSPVDPHLRSAPSRFAVVSFPGGPRTITIHPPGNAKFQSVIRDEKGDVILDLTHVKPLCREGAFRGPLEDVDWVEITRVCGRGPDLPGVPTTPPYPRWPYPSEPPSCPPPSRTPSDIIARQRQLATSMHTDLFGRVIPPMCVSKKKSPPLPSSMSSSPHDSSQDSQLSPSSSGVKLETVSPASSVPSSPTISRGKKRTRDDEDGDVPLAAEMRGEAPLVTDRQTIKEPSTPTPVKTDDSHAPEGLAKRKKPRSSAPVFPNRPLTRTHALLDVTRPA